MAIAATKTLNALLRGELSATETYDQALAKFGDTKGSAELRSVLADHNKAVDLLRKQIQIHGGEPEESSGAWGIFAKSVAGAAKLFGDDAALKALKEGEEHGINQYERAVKDDNLPADCVTLVNSILLPQSRAHIPVLDRLMAGLVERISPQQARKDLNVDPQAMLVCAYDSEEKFQQNHLEGAISLAEFESQLDSIPKNREIIFYCA